VKTQLEIANTCQCGALVLLKTNRETGEQLCAGSHICEGVFHNRYRCAPTQAEAKRLGITNHFRAPRGTHRVFVADGS
jgi:hypothetical protein